MANNNYDFTKNEIENNAIANAWHEFDILAAVVSRYAIFSSIILQFIILLINKYL